MRKQQLGVTIIELLMVLLIITAFLVLGIKQYQSWRFQQDTEQLKYNVDLLFQAMARFYKANCSANTNYKGTQQVSPGLLDPSQNPKSPFVVTVAKLRADGYLTDTFPANSFVDDSKGDGYRLQFNYMMPTPRKISDNENQSRSLGLMTLWTAQVAIKLREPEQASLYQTLLQADCESGVNQSGVFPCSPTPDVKGYLVWERLPSFASPRTRSGEWMSTPLLVQFKEQYTHDTFYELNNADWAKTQYYLCGG